MNYSIYVKKTIFIFFLSIFLSCSIKTDNQQIDYFTDFDTFSLQGIDKQNPNDNLRDSSFVKIITMNSNKKTITIPCCRGQYTEEYNYDGKYWSKVFKLDVEGCEQYIYTYYLNKQKEISLRYCGNPFQDAHYFLKSYSIASKESVVQYGFENEVVLNKMPWSVIDDNSILKTATYKQVSIYSLKENNLLEKYYYNYSGVEIDIGPKQYEKKEYYDLGNNSIYQFFNCQYCFKVIDNN